MSKYWDQWDTDDLNSWQGMDWEDEEEIQESEE